MTSEIGAAVGTDTPNATDEMPSPTPETPWRRLDKRMLVVNPIAGLVRLLPVLLIVLFTGRQSDPMQVWFPLGIAVLVVIGGVVRWRTTQYRITEDRVELHTGLLRRQRRSVPRDRIRTVDLTAKLLHRIFGLSVVHVGAGSGSPTESGELRLDAVSKAEADRLRRELLDRSATVAAPGTAEHTAPPRPPATELARLDWSWLRYAPLTFSAIAGIGAVGAAVFNLFGELGVNPRDISAVDDAADQLASSPIWAAVAILAALLLAVAVVGSMVLFAERWYGYRLTREASTEPPLPAAATHPAATPSAGIGTGTLRVRRGLLTRRSLSVSEQRLRGVEVVEPLLLRAGRGAYCKALSTGLTRSAQGGALQPPCPRAESHRVASAALREHPQEITLAPLRRHPRAALQRRLTRALVPTAVLVAGVFVAGSAVPALAGLQVPSLLLLPLGALVALDRFRNLGHQLTSRYLVSRQGSVQRRTVALQRAGVIGWTFRQSIFQRRSQLVTVEAITAAGAGGYQVLDVAAADGVALADAAVPHLLTPFLATPPGAISTSQPVR